MTTLWNGRLAAALDPAFARLNASLAFDRRLARQDVAGSLGWTRALARAGVLSAAEAEQLAAGLSAIDQEFADGRFEFAPGDEDIHTAVERRLAERIGPLAGKLHTGRSRNDQVATDFRLWLLGAGRGLDARLHALQAALVARAAADFGIVLPGYTHLQPAQPVLLSHWWLAPFWALARDRERLAELLARTAVLPLGSGALAGTAFAIDREALARDLGFAAVSENSLDAVADRDFAAEFLFWAALLGVHLSRLAEALIIFATAEFGFVALSDAYATGSSLMPQKKNPDALELVRARSGRLIGLLTGLLATLKGLPSAYDKDLQEDKPPVFEATDTLEAVLPVVTGLLAGLQVNPARMRAALGPALFATEAADYLVARGLPFRAAHHAVARAVARAEALGLALDVLPLAEWQALAPECDAGLFSVFDPERAVARRTAAGGTAPEAVAAQLAHARERLAATAVPAAAGAAHESVAAEEE
jgi:argininosuccinate lyase